MFDIGTPYLQILALPLSTGPHVTTKKVAEPSHAGHVVTLRVRRDGSVGCGGEKKRRAPVGYGEEWCLMQFEAATTERAGDGGSWWRPAGGMGCGRPVER